MDKETMLGFPRKRGGMETGAQAEESKDGAVAYKTTALDETGLIRLMDSMGAV